MNCVFTLVQLLRINPRGRHQPKIWELLCQLVVFLWFLSVLYIYIVWTTVLHVLKRVVPLRSFLIQMCIAVISIDLYVFIPIWMNLTKYESHSSSLKGIQAEDTSWPKKERKSANIFVCMPPLVVVLVVTLFKTWKCFFVIQFQTQKKYFFCETI